MRRSLRFLCVLTAAGAAENAEETQKFQGFLCRTHVKSEGISR